MRPIHDGHHLQNRTHRVQNRDVKTPSATLDWDDVRVFAAVARAASLLRGAREAGLDRSTASRRISTLERAVGARLFLRTREGLRLSAVGERLLQQAERMAAAAREFERTVTDDVEEVRGRVKLATTEALAATLVRRGLLELHTRHPALELELLGSNAVVDLTRGEADIALRVSKIDQPSLRVRRIMRVPFAAFASDAYLRRRGRPRHEGDLAGHDVLLLSHELAKLPETRWLADRPDTHVVLRTNSLNALLSGLSTGAGISVLALGDSGHSLGLTHLFDVPALPARALWLAMHPDAASRAAVRAVGDHIAQIMAPTR